jgi:hypothetical protein
MRRNFGIIAAAILVIATLIALSAAGNVELDRPTENEGSPIRSSYNAGPTGTRAFYQLLEESGTPVARWREGFELLEDQARDATLVLVGPFQYEFHLSTEEDFLLRKWVMAGGRALVISRFPRAQFGDSVIHARLKEKLPSWETPPEAIEQIIDSQSDDLIVQPTDLTRNLRGLALSEFASRMKFYAEAAETKPEAGASPSLPLPPPPPAPEMTPEPTPEGEVESVAAPSPTIPANASPEASPDSMPGGTDEAADEYIETLHAPVIHLGDKDGAVLADFKYGDGRVVFLSDPFVFANNGIARGANLTLALNLAKSLSEGGRKLYFDEFHHGYRDAANPLVNYFRGTPMPWLVLQGLLLAGLLLFTYGRRFARPLPLPRVDRHSPLEFVSSMANLQQAAEARDLALENIYPRFKAQLCRRLGLSSHARIEEIVARAELRRLPVSGDELRQALGASEAGLRGGRSAEAFDDAHLIKAVATMRRVIAHLKH